MRGSRGLKDRALDSANTIYTYTYIYMYIYMGGSGAQRHHCVSSLCGTDQALIGVWQQYLAEMNLNAMM